MFKDSLCEGVCPVKKGHPCFIYGEACRIRTRYPSIEHDAIVGHQEELIERGQKKVPKRPDNPESYLRRMAVNLEGDLIKGKEKQKAIHDAVNDEGPLAEYARQVKERGVETDAIEARDLLNFFLSKLPAEVVYPFSMATREFFILMLEGYKREELLRKFPRLDLREIRHHQAVIRQTREAIAHLL